MSTRLTLHAAPAAGFDEPFEMLLGCHERVERMLGLLERLAAHLDTHGCDDAARQAAQDVMRYFDLAGPAHHEDEERHVLPLLAAGPDAALQALAQRLRQDHRAMTEQWRAVVLERDEALPPAFQREQARNAGVDEIVSFDAGHSAFASRPRDLAALLLRYA